MRKAKEQQKRPQACTGRRGRILFACQPIDTRLPDDADIRASVAARPFQILRQTSSKLHVAILNPNYKPGVGVPVFAVVRLANCVSDAE